MPDRLRGSLAALGPPLLVAAVFLALRYWLALTPELAQTYYDEALTGLMGLAILRGVPQVFYWGQPYLGAVDAYLAAGAFGWPGPRRWRCGCRPSRAPWRGRGGSGAWPAGPPARHPGSTRG